MSEQVVVNRDTAQPESATFADYALPRAAALPTFSVELAEHPTPSNPLRIKGGGESGITPALAAAENAVADALTHVGQNPPAMPLTPNRLWSAVHHP